MVRAPSDLQAYLRRVRLRALALVSLRALGVGLACGGLASTAAALLLGPVPSRVLASVSLVVCLLAGLLASAHQLRRVRGLRGSKVTSLFARLSPELASRARSVLELSVTPPGTSPALIRAHRAHVELELRALPVRNVAPLALELPASLVALLLVALVASLTGLSSPRGRAGAYALVHAFDRDEPGGRRADLVLATAASLRFPAYHGRAPLSVDGADDLELPHGTSVSYRVRFLSPPARAALRLPSGEVRLTPLPVVDAGRGWYGAEFVASQGGPLSVVAQLEEGHAWVTDRRTRRLRVSADHEPVARLAGPENGADLPLDAVTRIGYAATDDIGVVELTLLIARPDGREERRVLERHPTAEARRLAQGSAEILPVDLGAQAGDVVTLTLEARDGDTLTGPHVARSAPLALRVASAGTRRLELLAGLEALLGASLDTLAERLETPLLREDRSDETDRARFERLSALDGRLLGALRTYATARGETASPFSALATRLERGIEQEARSYRARGTPDARQRADAAETEVLEALVLALDDLGTQERLADAAELARELLGLRRELASLVAELRRADTEEARRAVTAAIARARDRLAQLAQRIAAIDPSAVPSEFANREAAAREEARDALADLERALGADDLDAAERSVIALERQIDQLVSSLGQAEENYTEEHFGAQDRAMAEALDALAGLESEQRMLAERTDRVRRAAAARALDGRGEGGDPDSRRLITELRGTAELLAGVPEGGIAARDRETLSRARQRLVDAQDALAQGDFGEARRMVSEARADSLALSRDLELSALMFPGTGGRTARAAEQVASAARAVVQLESSLDRIIPDLREHLNAAESGQLRDDVGRQQSAAGATERLAGQFRDGPQGQALSDDAATRLESVGTQMEEARRSLQRLDALAAGARQAEAAEALRQLREELEEQSRGGEGGGGGGPSGGGASSNQRVTIPTADEHEGPQQFRRRVLDAMGQRAPGGYEEASRRYYERLLR